MPFCTNCGANAQGMKFCASCGAAVVDGPSLQQTRQTGGIQHQTAAQSAPRPDQQHIQTPSPFQTPGYNQPIPQAGENAAINTCPSCGSSIQPGIRFCLVCGHAFQLSQPVQPPMTAPQSSNYGPNAQPQNNVAPPGKVSSIISRNKLLIGILSGIAVALLLAYGWILWKKESIESIYERAERYWYRLAANQGNVEAQNNLGEYYASGQGVVQDYEEAVKWYRLAAEQRYAEAQNNLGECYASGQGVVQDYEEAVKWHRLAADQGNADAQCQLGLFYADGQGVAQNYSEAVMWFRLAADRGNADAQCQLGLFYAGGQGVSQNPSEAIRWMRLAADQGNENAKRWLSDNQ